MLTVREAAEKLGVAAPTVRLWLREGMMEGAELKESELGVPYWSIPESTVNSFERPKTGRPQKPLSELKGKPRRKKQAN